MLQGQHSPVTKPSNKGVLNLSSFKMTKHHEEVLSRGLTFCPTPEVVPLKQFKLGCERFCRTLKIKYNLNSIRKTNSEERFRIPSNFVPERTSYPPEIDELDIKLKQAIRKIPHKFIHKSNLSHSEKSALKELKNNDAIVIKKADKGSATVILNKQDYVEEALRQLGNKIHYKPISEPVYPEFCQKFNSVLDEMHKKKFITLKEKNYLWATTDCRERRFYLLPKIHKPRNKWVKGIPPGRPIVSDVNSESYRIAAFVDHNLTPYCTQHPAYVRNTYDFLEKIKNIIIPHNALLISLDVASLYTNIDPEFGMGCIEELFRRRPNPIQPYILSLLRLCLEGNDFVFNEKFYLQISGTAMGRKFAPKYADMVMSLWEEKSLALCRKLPSIYLRYLDDIFIIWPHSRAEFDEFFEVLNGFQPRIKLEANIQEKELEFLDVLVYKGEKFQSEGVLDTRVYFKPTDSHALLHKSSFHPRHCFKGLVKSQLIRFARICTWRYDFERACATLFNSLVGRGYSKRLLRGIKDSIVKTWYNSNPIGGMSKCGSALCKICPHVSNKIEIQTNNGVKPLENKGNCNTGNAVFLAFCGQCPDSGYFVGCSQNLRRCLTGLLNLKMRHDRDRFVLHFANSEHKGVMKFSILENFTKPEIGEKLLNKWITELNSISEGLNDRSEVRDTTPTPLILCFSPFSGALVRLVRDWWAQFEHMFPGLTKNKPLRLIHAHARNKNFNQLLVRAKLRERVSMISKTGAVTHNSES